MLTKDEAVAYLQDVLLLNNAGLSMTPGNERLETLNSIIVQLHRIPFQCLSLLSCPPEKRHRPTQEEIKEACTTKIGGLCYTLNVFLFYLLRALGYDVSLNLSHVVTGQPNNHVLVLVRNVKSEADLYLAEVGCGFSTFQAISLDFSQESQLYRDAYHQYKFVKKGTVLQRLYLKNDRFNEPRQEGFQIFYKFEIDPTTDIEKLDAFFDDIYSNVDALRFHKILVARRFTPNETIQLINYGLTIEKDGEFIKMELKDEDVVNKTRLHFPEFDEDLIRTAFAHLRSIKNVEKERQH